MYNFIVNSKNKLIYTNTVILYNENADYYYISDGFDELKIPTYLVVSWFIDGLIDKQFLTKPVYNFEMIKNCILKITLLTDKQLTTETQEKEAVLARYLLIWYSIKLLNVSFTALGKLVRPNKPLCHSTVIHGIKRINNEIGSNKKIMRYISQMNEMLNYKDSTIDELP